MSRSTERLFAASEHGKWLLRRAERRLGRKFLGNHSAGADVYGWRVHPIQFFLTWPYDNRSLMGGYDGGRSVDTTWMAEGKCRELPPETFFPSDGVGVEVARRICADCPAKAPCLEYALYNRIEHGVWGGASERERRRIARQRRSYQHVAIS